MEERGITNLMFRNAMICKRRNSCQSIILKNDSNGPLTQCYSEYTMYFHVLAPQFAISPLSQNAAEFRLMEELVGVY